MKQSPSTRLKHLQYEVEQKVVPSFLPGLIAQRTLCWLWPPFSGSKLKYVHPPDVTWCNTPTDFSAYLCVTTINPQHLTHQDAHTCHVPYINHYSRNRTSALVCGCVCATVWLVMIVSSQLLSLALHWWTGTLIKELCTVMTRIDFQFPVEWLYHCLWLRQFSLYYSAS